MERERELTSVLGGVLHICGQVDTPCTATFRYQREDPAAVSVDFEAGNKQRWRFSRDLVREALRCPDSEQGLGDVRTTYLEEQGVFRIVLSGVDGLCAVYLDAQAVAEFIQEVYYLVPIGADILDIDALLGEIS